MKKKYRFIVLSILILAAVSTILNPSFLSGSNIITIFRQASILLILSLGLTCVILTGNIDLSVGQVAALTGCVCAKMMVNGMSIPISMGLSMLVGIVIGLINGLLVGWLGLPSFVATYGMNMVASGLALMVMNGGIIYDLPIHFTWLGVGYAGKIPVPIIIAFLLLVLFVFLLQKTTFGRNIYMTGLNRKASIYSGIHDLALVLGCYILCGVTASFGGIMMTARLNAADAGMSETYGLQIVAAVVVGGTSLLGGEGGVEGTFFGAIILTIILNMMNMNGIDSNWQNLVLGIVIIIMVWINIAGRKRLEENEILSWKHFIFKKKIQ